ncbi:hypothetical protein [Rhodohalobacter sp.]|uniref:hypothetical protein n=1 Tax=Rhodohalobacter sp. TaxID=1974210 RepID=UPI002ACD7A27|nr:hypothetical protein [Rhodohalobacter sp.]MDZ7755746.1 hypothetical protein [Rhodohalobacter sp.]
MRYLILSVFVPILFITGCAPEPVFRLESQQDDVLNYRGMEYLHSEGENSSVTMAYYRHMGQQIVMDVEIVNYSDSIVQIDTPNFKYSAKHEYSDGSYDPLGGGTAYDPEQIILNLDLASSRAEASERTSRVLDGLSTTASIASDIANAGNQTTEEIIQRENERTRSALERMERRDQFYARVSSLNEQRAYWETEVLRKTDLYPEEAIAGEVRFPVVEDANVVEFSVIVGGEEHHFVYRQKKFKP